jgi:anthranilate phosphoribosyltransferase
VAGALHELGHERALVVHGDPGLDELSPLGPTQVVELGNGELRHYEVHPREFGWEGMDPRSLDGGDPPYNATVILEVFRGERRDAARAAVTLNAGAALYVAGTVDSLPEGVAAAERALTDGAALEGLERLRAATRRARSPRR